MNPSLKAIGVTLLASVVTVWTTACSNDLPTDAAEKLGPDAVQNQVAPTNDDFAAAEVITALPFTDSDITTDATSAPDDPANDCVIGGFTVWYQFSPFEDMRINANTIGSDYDTGIAVYTGTRGALTQIVCNDDAVGVQSSVTFEAEAGTTYFFMVGSFGDSPGGNLVFNVDVAVGLTIDPSGSVNGKTGIATIRGTVTCPRPLSVTLFGQVRQQAGRVFIDGSFFTSFECDGVTTWEAQTEQQNGLFKGGEAEVSIFADFFDPATGGSTFDQVTATVRLKGKGK
jgi:hypothetical protein